METTILTGWRQPIIITAGMTSATGGRIFGVFADEADARSINADALAIGTVGASCLTPEQIAMSERNSDRLCD